MKKFFQNPQFLGYLLIAVAIIVSSLIHSRAIYNLASVIGQGLVVFTPG